MSVFGSETEILKQIKNSFGINEPAYKRLTAADGHANPGV